MTRYSTSMKSKMAKNQSRKQISLFKLFKSKLIGALIVVVVLASALLYLFEINNMAVTGYQIRELEKQVAAVKAENEHLELKTVELQSMKHLRERVGEYNFVEAAQINYVSWHDTSFVQR